MLSKKKYHNTSISPGTAGKYVRKDSLTQDEGISTSVSSQSEIKAPFDISQLPILNPGTIQHPYGFRRDGRDRHPVKRTTTQAPNAKVVMNVNQPKLPSNPVSSMPLHQSTDPFLKVSPYTAPVAMMSTQIPSHITMGVAQPVQLVHSGQKSHSQVVSGASSALGTSSGEVGESSFGVYPVNFGASQVGNEVCMVTGEPLVPPNPMVHAEIPEWIRVYVRAHPRHDDKLKWNMFSLSKLTDFDLMVKWQMKREIEEIVLAYERYRTAIIQEMHRRKIDASRYIMPS